jgi:hypothetical protein
MEQSDVAREAKEMVQLYGEQATIISGMRAKRSADRSDTQKFHFWNRVTDAIKDIQRTTPTTL